MEMNSEDECQSWMARLGCAVNWRWKPGPPSGKEELSLRSREELLRTLCETDETGRDEK